MKGEEMTGRVGRMDGMGDLAEFLLACFAEDEHRAECAAMEIPQVRESGEVWGVWIGKKWYQGSAFASHIDHWMPARVLAKCAADRRIVEEVAPAVDSLSNAYVDATDEAADWPSEHLLRLLALPYADHPDFREEWKP